MYYLVDAFVGKIKYRLKNKMHGAENCENFDTLALFENI
jgi:hypothetical protein